MKIVQATHEVVTSDHEVHGTVFQVSLKLELPIKALHDPEAMAAFMADVVKNHSHFKYMRSTIIER